MQVTVKSISVDLEVPVLNALVEEVHQLADEILDLRAEVHDLNVLLGAVPHVVIPIGPVSEQSL